MPSKLWVLGSNPNRITMILKHLSMIFDGCFFIFTHKIKKPLKRLDGLQMCSSLITVW